VSPNLWKQDSQRVNGKSARTQGRMVPRMSRRPAKPVASLAVAAALTAMVTGCAAAASNNGSTSNSSAVSPGFAGGKVRLASTFPVSLAGPGQMLGYSAYFNYINKTQGGVKMANGKRYKIVFQYLDDGYDTGRAVANVKQWLATYHPAAVIAMTGSAINLATIGLLDAAKVPDLYSSEGDDFWQQQVSKYPMFGPTQDPSDNLWMASQIAYIKTKWPGAKLALLAQNDAYGQDITNAVKNDIKGTGLKLVDEQWYNTGAPSVSTQVAALQSSGANVFINTSLPPAMIQSIQYAKTIGWKAPDFICYSCATTTLLTADGSAANGIYAPLVDIDPSSPQWADAPAVTKLKGIITTYGPTGSSASNAEDLDGAAFAELIVENLEASQPTSQSLLNAARNQSGTYDPLLLPGTSVTTSPKYPYYVNRLTIAQYNSATEHWTLMAPPYVDPTFQSG
jgi:branched-chain amino acid transport system substrate-binding protein